jgi:RimJ/RimL family protein N-acetyltransferase
LNESRRQTYNWNMHPQAITLTGRFVRLEPLGLHHAEGLLAIGRDECIWTHMTQAALNDLSSAQARVHEALAAQAAGAQLPFAIVEIAGGRVAGSTRYLNISPADRGLEIGFTWLGVEFQRTAINTECKLLLLRHAFERLGAVRVQLKTDALNLRSRAAIERLGAVFEGVLRKYQLTRNGRIRDTAMYSITSEEWPTVHERLAAFLSG